MKKTYPTFEVGQTVMVKSNKGSGKGVIEEVERTFLEVHPDGSFNSGGLLTLESTIKSICLPYTFDGEMLKVEHPEHDFGGWVQKAHTHTSKFKGFAYSVRLEGRDYRLLVGEKQIKAL